MKASQVEAVGRLVDNALDAAGRVRNLAPAPAAVPVAAPAPAASAPEDSPPHAEILAAILEDRLAALWKAFTAAEARVRELEAALAARAAAPPGSAPSPAASERAVAAETLLAEMRERVALLEKRLAESEGRRHELERLNAAHRGQLDDLLRRLGALEAQASDRTGPRVVRVPVREQA